ncbi:MAG: glycosyltransferase family 4 protein [Candidatus Azambacteria bacterium]|nr:glycosyltransferase family 4 protein [Candidatus Azambacteria bacterium]
MKIIYITNSRIPTEKAHGFQVMKMCEAFSNAGVELELWIPGRFNQIKENPLDYYNIRKTFKIRKIFVVDLIPLSKYLGWFANFIESVSFALFALFHLYRSDSHLSASTIIYSRDQFVCWFLSFLNRKFIYEIHSFPKNLFWYKKLWRQAYRVVAITQGLKNLLIKQGIKAEKIVVAPDGVDLEAFNAVNQPKEELKIELDLPANDFLVGYIGKFKTLGMEKGIKTMITALPLLEKDIKMVFVGGEELEIKEYKNLASRLNVSTQCLFINYQPYLKVIKYTKAMDALVIPFPNFPHYAFYASPLKMFEYMASGRPIIASDLPALREVLNDKSSLFFKPESAEDLARAIKMLKASQMLGYHLSRQALADVKQYTWENRVRKILEFIK